MRPNVVPADTGRRVASFAAAVLALCAPAAAGDRALIDYLGYSDDGHIFAFEEFGIQDGSGFPYANIYVIDLATDSWVAGTPVRVRIDDETADVEEAREQVRDEAAAMLDGRGIGVAAQVLAVNGDGEAGIDRHALSFGRPGYGLDEPQDPMELTLATFPANSPQGCESYMGERALGFALSLDSAVIHADGETLPNSRGCPMDYRIHAVVAPADWTGISGGRVAIIASYPFGFEGPDRRFLAVPLPD